MAIIKCPECGHEISDKAPACIHCGFPIPKKQEESKEDSNQKYQKYYIGLSEASPSVCNEIDSLLQKGEKIQAIKYLREHAGNNMSLYTAKAFIDNHVIGKWEKYDFEQERIKNEAKTKHEVNEQIKAPDTPKRKKKHTGLWVFSLIILLAIGGIVYYKTKVVVTVASVNGNKHQVGHFGYCDFCQFNSKDGSTKEATHRIKQSNGLQDVFCDSCWEEDGEYLFEKFSSESSKSNNKGSSDDESMAIVYARDIVRDKLKSPSTAKFPWLDVKAEYLGNRRYKITSYVDAQNSFGAIIRSYWTVELTLTANGYTDVNVTIN